jgi:hypothetical protein
MKMHNRAVRELIAFLKARMQPAPWEVDRIPSVAAAKSTVRHGNGALHGRTALGGEH